MEFTGERMIPEKNNEDIIFSEHIIRYIFAKQFVKDKNVLDIACGSGYGSFELSKSNPIQVTGVDISLKSIEYAKSKYNNRNLEYLQGDATNLPFSDNTFDVIVSFETIEHLQDYELFVQEISRCSKDNALLVISTPNKEIYPEGNEFHFKEFTKKEFHTILKKQFKFVDLINQNSFYVNSLFKNKNQIKDNKTILTDELIDTGMYFIALCSNNELPFNYQVQNLISKPKEILTTDILNERNKHIDILKKEVDNEKDNMLKKVDIISEREKHISILIHENEELKKNHENLNTNINDKIDTISEREKHINILVNENEELKNNIEFLKTSTQYKIKLLEKTAIQYNNRISELITIFKNKDLQYTELAEKNTLQQKIFFEKSSKLKKITDLFKQTEIQLEKTTNLNTELQTKLDNITFRTNIVENNLNDDIQKIKNSISWKLTKPLRFFANIFILMYNVLLGVLKDLIYGLSLLKREGLSIFFYRLFWYLKGNRLPEDIFIAKRKSALPKANKLITDTNIPIVFEKIKNPVVSIIIPVFNQWQYTYNCLKSIKENTKDISYEIIIGDDSSSDETRNINKIVKNITVIRNSTNLYFIKNCNKAANHAKGEYLLFLNNDVVVHQNWLEPLVRIAEKDKKVGMVGSKLIYPDGRLQEAGGIIWNDASGWNYGRLDDPEKPDYNYTKEVDYVSGASLLINKKLWNELGGFDHHYLPAYYEDTDLAFRVRENGYKVIYQPESLVTHFEGISNGKNESEGLKKYQSDNKKKFYNRWKNNLNKDQFKNGENVFLARERSAYQKTILVIDHYVPHFDQDAGSRSTFSYLKLLVKMGFNVKFIGDNFFKHEPYTTVLQQIGIEVLYGSYYKKNIKQWIKENGKYIDFVFTHRMHIAPIYLEDLKKYTKAKIAYIGHDLQFLSSQRKYELTKDKCHKDDAVKFKDIEKTIFNIVDFVLPFSTLEENHIKKLAPNKIVQSIPVYFYDSIPDVKNRFNDRKNLLFVGGFAHPPNEDGLLWFVNNVFDDIKKEYPEIKLYVVGSKPTEKVKKLASESIIITGYVSDKELENYYSTCKVAILPLQFGAGVKGKLLESLYYQIPAVITSVAAEGVPDIENHSLITNDPNTFVTKIDALYSDEELWEKYSQKGKSLIQKYYTEQSVSNTLQKILNL